MSGPFASGKRAIALCDRCGFQFKLKTLRKLTINDAIVDLKVCKECFEQDHPQLKLGKTPIQDPQALRDPRPDSSYLQSGLTTLGTYGEGSRVIKWAWNPLGDGAYAPFPLLATAQVGSVTVNL